MKNMKVGTRLALGYGAVTLVMAILCAAAVVLIMDLYEEVAASGERRLPNVITAGKFSVSLLQTARHTRNMLILDDPLKIQAEVAANEVTVNERAEYLAYLLKNVRSPETRVQLEKVQSARNAYLPLEKGFIDLVKQAKFTEAKGQLLGDMRPAQLLYLAELNKLTDILGTSNVQANRDLLSSALARLKVMGAGMLLAFALAAVIAMLSSRSIVRPLMQAVELANQIAKGNLRNAVEVKRGDELGMLLGALGAMQGNLAGLVRQVQIKAADLTSAASELATTAQQVSAATSNQSEAAASMAASIEEMTVSVNHITDSAAQASDKTAESAQLSDTGRQVVDNAGTEVSAIASGIQQSADLVKILKDHSDEISSMANVIKNITEQTNLLALNAAIEAARAGEHGRGFAVVADAVRNLAERTARSTEEISATINKIQSSTVQVFNGMNESVVRAQSGMDLSKEAGRVISQLSVKSGEVQVVVREISSALREQSQASNDIARHVESIAQMAQENSGAVEQTQHSAQLLKNLAADLQSSVMTFSV